MPTSDSSYQDFSFDDGDEKVGKKAKRFKGKEGETYRVSFVWFKKKEDGSPNFDKLQFTGAERHYVQSVGYFLHKGPEYSKLAGGPPKQSVATVIVVWPTDKKGKLNPDAFKRGEGFQVFSWVFSPDRYEQLHRRHEEFPLTEFDITIACTDTQYQKMDVSPCKDNLFRKLITSDNEKAKAIGQAILDEVTEIEKTIRTDLARDLTLEQIREKLGGGGASTGPSPEMTAEDVDNLLGDILT
jgi:hypothetical protein